VDLQLKGKLALISGSTAGIGLAIATSLAREGTRVIVNGRTAERTAEAAAQIRANVPGANIEEFAADLSLRESAELAFQRFPSVDVLVNNLGTYSVKAFDQITDEDWMAIIQTNFLSGVRLSRYYLPKMKAAGWGRIIFISSESAVNIPTEMIHYGVTKTMQIALARGLAETTSGTGVTVNTILPGPTRSEGVEKFLHDVARDRKIGVEQVEKEFFHTMRPSSIIQRFATTEEVAALTTFVASPLSSATNGAALRVEGGVVRSIL
jgi:NAD(P)-dependent dehydrogenase (short-subunit alcohol dehydrogenase family)